MINQQLADKLIAELSEHLNLQLHGAQWAPVSGGDICQSYSLSAGDNKLFVKVLPDPQQDVLRQEHYSLQQMARLIPKWVNPSLHFCTLNSFSCLVFPFCRIQSRGDFRALGEALAGLHLALSANSASTPSIDGRYGWPQDNYIGTTPQINTARDSWAEFFVDNRLRPQIRMASEIMPIDPDRARALYDFATDLLSNHQPTPSLLHGDLWQGNLGFSEDGSPLFYDPASYIGDPETDIAMTSLFGSPPDSFYDGYYTLLPPQPGRELRHQLYNLYHLLNHVNLFGGSYVSAAERTISSLLSR